VNTTTACCPPAAGGLGPDAMLLLPLLPPPAAEAVACAAVPPMPTRPVTASCSWSARWWRRLPRPWLAPATTLWGMDTHQGAGGIAPSTAAAGDGGPAVLLLVVAVAVAAAPAAGCGAGAGPAVRGGWLPASNKDLLPVMCSVPGNSTCRQGGQGQATVALGGPVHTACLPAGQLRPGCATDGWCHSKCHDQVVAHTWPRHVSCRQAPQPVRPVWPLVLWVCGCVQGHGRVPALGHTLHPPMQVLHSCPPPPPPFLPPLSTRPRVQGSPPPAV
jgi:hypothetical protein